MTILPSPAGQPSEYVRWVQSGLNQILGMNLPVDGMMNAQTRSALRSFQEKNGLTPDGIVGPDTEQALKSARSGSSGGPVPGGTNGNGSAAVNGNGAPPAPDAAPVQEEPPSAEEAEGIFTAIKDFITGPQRIIDRTHLSPKEYRIRQRDPKTVYALVLHQMAFSRGSDPDRYNKVKSHYAILPDGKILQLHPVSALLYASNGFNNRSVAVEFAGNFPSVKGRCWKADKYGCHKLTQAQVEAGRYLIRHLNRQIGLSHVLAHRQSSGTRENDPGPDIWYNVGQWAIDNLGLKDGGPGFKIDSGNPILNAWRTWGKSPASTSPELEQFIDEYEMEDEWLGWLKSALGMQNGQASTRAASPTKQAAYQTVKQAYTSTSGASKITALRSNLVNIAKAEWNRWNAGGKKKERDPQVRQILQDYWKTGVGLTASSADVGSSTWQNSHPWSAAFISWVVRKAGGGSDFAYSASHSVYTKAAKDNRLARNANPFKAYRISEVRPEPGDIVCKSRAGSGATYDNIREGMSTHCDIVTDVQPGKIITIGGNLSDSVSTTTVTTDTNGRITTPGYFAVIKPGATIP